MVTSLKQLLAPAIVVAIATCVVPASAAPPAQRPQESASCSDVEHVLLLVDQSKSLQRTDPTGQRRVAGEALIDVFASSAVPVRLTIAGFGNKVMQQGEFDLGGPQSDVDAAKSALAAVVSKADDRNTDYVAALQFAVQFFAGTPGSDPACRSMVWFTDGAYDIERTEPTSEYDVSQYTSLTDDKAIEQQFEAQVCGDAAGAVPLNSKLSAPLSTQIRDQEFSISFIDLQAGTKDQLRIDTERVIDRLLRAEGDDCRVEGRWTTVGDTARLFADFFIEGQRALGRVELKDCGVLGTGLPISAVKSVAALADDPNSTVQINGPTGVISSGSQATFAVLSPEQRRSSGLVSVSVSEGAVAHCFVETEVESMLASRPSIYSKAESATIAIRVTGGGLEGKPEGALSDDLVDVEITINGVKVPNSEIVYDAETREFQVVRLGPFEGTLVIEAIATFTATGIREREALREEIEVKEDPPTPRANWIGKTLIEGAGTLTGTVLIESDIDGPGTMCITISADSPIMADDGKEIGQFSMAASEEVCKPLNEPIRFDATATFPEALNAFGSVSINYEAAFESSTGERRILDPGTLRVEFSEVKPANPAAGLLFAAVVAVIIAVLSYLLLFAFARRQNRLLPPSQWLVAEADVRKEERIGAPGNTEFVGDGRFQVSELGTVRGTRRVYEVAPFTVQSIWPLNPLAELRAIARSNSGLVVSFPSRNRRADIRNRAFVPIRFQRLSIINVTTERITMRILMPRGSTAAHFESAMNEALVKSQSALLEATQRLGSTRPGTGGSENDSGGSSSGGGSPGGGPPSPKPPTGGSKPVVPPSPPIASPGTATSDRAIPDLKSPKLPSQGR